MKNFIYILKVIVAYTLVIPFGLFNYEKGFEKLKKLIK